MQKERLNMANNNVKTQTKQSEMKTPVKNEPTYTIEEFASAPESVGANADIVEAALASSGKDKFTVNEAKEIVNKFKKKEVK
jgi:hypothetical protein